MFIRLRGLLAWLLLAPFASDAGARPVILGLVAPPSEADSASLLRGVQLAVAEASEAGGAPVALEVRSEDGQWGTVGNDAVTLVTDRHVDAIIAPSDGAATHLILQVSGRMRVPVVSVCADSSVTEAGVPWAARVVPRTDREAETLFAAARSWERPPSHWWAVIPAGRAGKVVRRDLAAAARSTNTDLARIVESAGQQAGVPVLAREIVAAAPGGVLLWLTPARAGTLAAALRSAGYAGQIAGPAPLDAPEFVAAAGAAATGVMVATFRVATAPGTPADNFERRYRKKYGARPDFSSTAAYDAARVLIETLRRAGADDGYRQFPLTRPIAGAAGVLHFDASGNRDDPLQVRSCQNGRFVPAEPPKTLP